MFYFLMFLVTMHLETTQTNFKRNDTLVIGGPIKASLPSFRVLFPLKDDSIQEQGQVLGSWKLN